MGEYEGVLQFGVVVLAVSAPFLIGAFVRHYFRYRSMLAEQKHEAAGRIAEESHAELREQVAALKERVEVLEAIVTKENYELGRKIANL